MAHENFRITIRKDGTIHLASREIGEDRLRELRDMIEDCLGPVGEVRVAEPGELPPSGVTKLEEDAAREIQSRKI